MSKYVKELMMDQLRSDLDGSRSVLILDLKGLDAVAEYQFRRDMRKKSIRVRALKNSLAQRVFTEMGMDGLSKYLEGPSVLVWGGDGVAELAKEVSTQVKTLKKPEIKGGAVDGVVIGPGPGRRHHQAPQPRAADRPGCQPGAGAGAADRGPGQRPGGQPDEPAQDDFRGGLARCQRAEGIDRPTSAPAMEPKCIGLTPSQRATNVHSRQGASDTRSLAVF